MPYKRRFGPTQREPAISARALELYAQAKRLLQKPETEARESAIEDVSRELAVELRLKPWATDPLDTICFARSEHEDPEYWLQASALAEELEDALRERRRAQRKARKAVPPQQPQPPLAS